MITIPDYKETFIYNYGVDLINARSFWDRSYKGQGINVAVIDSGCYVDHYELKDNIIDGFNFTDDDDGQINIVTDYIGHGTHVSGIIAAANRKGIVGVAPNANLLILKTIGKDGSGNFADLIRALNFAVEWRGKNNEKIDVINLSLGATSDNIELKKVISKIISSDILIVSAAGNIGDGSDLTDEILYPGFYEEVIQVSAIDQNKKPTHFSNTNKNIDFLAPGKDIYSTFPGNEFVKFSGTSMAAPHVTGSIALLLNFFREQNIPIDSKLVYEYLVLHSLLKDDYSKKVQGNGIIQL